MLEVTQLARSFGETRALRSCTFTARAGMVHCILGENGSGKSTLVKILAGVLSPSSGEIRIAGSVVTRFAPLAAQKAGVAAVFQETLVAPNRSVMENVFLGQGGGLGRGLGGRERRALARRTLSEISRVPVNVDMLAGALPLAQRQLVTIARALVREPQILILDEATSALGVEDRELVFERVRKLREEGVLVIFISHHLDEILELSDVVTILRSGESVAELPNQGLKGDELLRLMSPPQEERSGASPSADEFSRARAADAGARPLLRASGLQLSGDAKALPTVEVGTGEIVGVVGLDGHGQEAFLEILCGLRQPQSGDVSVIAADGRPIRVKSHFDAARLGVVYLPRDRKSEGILPSLSVLDNFAVAAVESGRGRRFGFVRRRFLHRSYAGFREDFGITAASSSASIVSLSGGNQQKVLLARYMLLEPNVMVLNDPARGVDASTKLEFYEIFRRTVESGRAIVLLSTDLEELVELCNRVLVFRRGELVAELEESKLDMDAVLAAMFGRQ